MMLSFIFVLLKSEGTYKNKNAAALACPVRPGTRVFCSRKKVSNNAFSRLVLPYSNFAGNLLKGLRVDFSKLFCNNIGSLSCKFSKTVAGFSTQRARLRDSLGFERKTEIVKLKADVVSHAVCDRKWDDGSFSFQILRKG